MREEQYMAGNHMDVRTCLRASRALVAALLCAGLAGALASCGARSSGNAAATATAAAQATQAAQPVLVTFSARQEGTVAAKTVQLVVDVTVRNQTAAPIYLAYSSCRPPVISVELYDASNHLTWHNYIRLAGCVKGATGCPTAEDGDTVTDQMVAPATAYPWSMKGDLNANNPNALPQAGTTYTVRVIVRWQSQPCSTQGTPTTPPPLHTITVQAPITLQ